MPNLSWTASFFSHLILALCWVDDRSAIADIQTKIRSELVGDPECRTIPANEVTQYQLCIRADEFTVRDREGNVWQVDRHEFSSQMRLLARKFLDRAGVATHLYRFAEMRIWLLQKSNGQNFETSFRLAVQGDFGGFSAGIQFDHQNQSLQETAVIGAESLGVNHLGFLTEKIVLETSEPVVRQAIEPFVERLGGRLDTNNTGAQMRWNIQVSSFSEIGFCSTAIADMTRPSEICACRLLPISTDRLRLVEPVFDLGFLAP